jgi:uncharacterized protein
MKSASTRAEGLASWHAARDRAVWSAHGIASLSLTQWLTAKPLPVEGIEGLWLDAGGTATRLAAAGLPARMLSPGEHLEEGPLRVYAFEREGSIAVRVYDPAARNTGAARTLDRYPDDPTWVSPGRFVPGSASALPAVSVDGHVSASRYDGVVTLSHRDQELELLVVDRGSALHATFSDATGTGEAYRFRMLLLPLPDAAGRLEVDLNKAFLPPCALSPHYVCVLPPAPNRWDVAVRAGERDITVGATATS